MQRDSFLNHFKNFLLLLVVFFSEKVRGASVLDSFGAFAFAFSICLFVCGSFFFFFFFFSLFLVFMCLCVFLLCLRVGGKHADKHVFQD
jgi:hypothetical protein